MKLNVFARRAVTSPIPPNKRNACHCSSDACMPEVPCRLVKLLQRKLHSLVFRTSITDIFKKQLGLEVVRQTCANRCRRCRKLGELREFFLTQFYGAPFRRQGNIIDTLTYINTRRAYWRMWQNKTSQF